jgi:hypothetical protein
MAKSVNAGKQFKSKPAGGFAPKTGGSGKMQKFSGAAPQKPGQTAQQSSGKGKGPDFLQGGPSGKMAGASQASPQKAGVTHRTNASARSSYAK